VLDAIDDIIQETFPSHSDAPTPNDINNAPGGNSPSVRDQTETFPTGSDPSLDPNNINNPGTTPVIPPGPPPLVLGGERPASTYINESRRTLYLGSTPGKDSPVGQQVQERMRQEGTLRDNGGESEVLDANGNWHNIQ
jgi:hypothetical protein